MHRMLLSDGVQGPHVAVRQLLQRPGGPGVKSDGATVEERVDDG